MTTRDEILVRLLASTHAVWIPTRTWDNGFPGKVYYTRQRYRRLGCRWASGSDSNAGQQEASRQLRELRRAGLVTVARPRAIKTLYAKLTDEGEHRASALVGIGNLADCLAMMQRIAELENEPDALVGNWVSEERLWAVTTRPVELEKYRVAAGAVTAKCLWGLSREWVAASSDGAGRGYYRLLPAGRVVLEDPPAIPKRLPRPDEGGGEVYDEAREAARAEIRQADENAAEIGDIPISCSPITRGMVAERAAAQQQPAA
jgi:DNA-binding transcriptional ArsR family regulator